MVLEDLRHAQRERLLHLDRCLTWRGRANRRDLTGRFGISAAQAALDLRLYQSRAPVPPVYDSGLKTYLAAPGHVPLAPGAAGDAFEALGPLVEDAASPPARRGDHRAAALCARAMERGEDLETVYVSMRSGEAAAQWLAPRRFFRDGDMLLVRAFSFRRGEWRSYLPVRFAPEAEARFRPGAPLPPDAAWETKVILRLAPCGDLSAPQRAAVRREYGIAGETLELETREALLPLLRRRWGLDAPHARLEVVTEERRMAVGGQG